VRAPQEMETTIISYFCKSKDWKLVFWDDKSFLWVKNLPKFQDIISKYEYKYLNPYTVVYQKSTIEKGLKDDKATVKKEIERNMAEEPNGVIVTSAMRMYGSKLN
jgi:hypothetical protein